MTESLPLMYNCVSSENYEQFVSELTCDGERTIFLPHWTTYRLNVDIVASQLPTGNQLLDHEWSWLSANSIDSPAQVCDSGDYLLCHWRVESYVDHPKFDPNWLVYRPSMFNWTIATKRLVESGSIKFISQHPELPWDYIYLVVLFRSIRDIDLNWPDYHTQLLDCLLRMGHPGNLIHLSGLLTLWAMK